MEKYTKEDLELAYKYVKEGAILLSSRVEGLNGLETKLRMDMIKVIFDELGYFYKTNISGIAINGSTKIDISYLFPYPNSTMETFGAMLYKLQKVADDYDFDLILYDEVESQEYMSFGMIEIAA